MEEPGDACEEHDAVLAELQALRGVFGEAYQDSLAASVRAITIVSHTRES